MTFTRTSVQIIIGLMQSALITYLHLWIKIF